MHKGRKKDQRIKKNNQCWKLGVLLCSCLKNNLEIYCGNKYNRTKK